MGQFVWNLKFFCGLQKNMDADMEQCEQLNKNIKNVKSLENVKETS